MNKKSTCSSKFNPIDPSGASWSESTRAARVDFAARIFATLLKKIEIIHGSHSKFKYPKQVWDNKGHAIHIAYAIIASG